MPRKSSEAAKTKQHRGQIGENYQAWIQSQEFSMNKSIATTFTDWKNGRTMHFVSMSAFYAYILLRFRDDVENIYECYPLEIEATNAIADKLGYRRVAGGQRHMVSDLLVEYTNGTTAVYCIKSSQKTLDLQKHKRIIEKLYIELCYWKGKGYPWTIIFADEMIDKQKAIHIKNCAEFWDPLLVTTKEELFRYQVIHRLVSIDLSKKIDFALLAEYYISNEEFTNFMNDRENYMTKPKQTGFPIKGDRPIQ